ncbi:hypothetical protein PPERSA_03021 [Pseudocohnilembus persalinus]|uniref:Uncharacterized protein n=1 Tax=Pseudocohnilembus persalinus TaxID=266149 RepID=A0A0V0QEX3_PSEPJ|nr:hypothetical protein PPERSA_03021 [Pseudocohnilembus persalinus]|eukprot:KRX00761.1 hypothetical protein PPERSA_03021 [Pseudocohnilembus persalinus]
MLEQKIEEEQNQQIKQNKKKNLKSIKKFFQKKKDNKSYSPQKNLINKTQYDEDYSLSHLLNQYVQNKRQSNGMNQSLVNKNGNSKFNQTGKQVSNNNKWVEQKAQTGNYFYPKIYGGNDEQNKNNNQAFNYSQNLNNNNNNEQNHTSIFDLALNQPSSILKYINEQVMEIQNQKLKASIKNKINQQNKTEGDLHSQTNLSKVFSQKDAIYQKFQTELDGVDQAEPLSVFEFFVEIIMQLMYGQISARKASENLRTVLETPLQLEIQDYVIKTIFQFLFGNLVDKKIERDFIYRLHKILMFQSQLYEGWIDNGDELYQKYLKTVHAKRSDLDKKMKIEDLNHKLFEYFLKTYFQSHDIFSFTDLDVIYNEYYNRDDIELYDQVKQFIFQIECMKDTFLQSKHNNKNDIKLILNILNNQIKSYIR